MTTFFTLEESGNQQNKLIKLSVKDDTANLNDFIQLEKDDLHALQAFQLRYKNRPQDNTQKIELKKLGQDIYQWLNRQCWLDTIINTMPITPWVVEFQLTSPPQSDFQKAFINMPWECLADEQEFLAGKIGLNYSSLRRLGSRKTPKKASDYRLSVLFMAASPIGSNSLNYEAEEIAILDASGGINQSQLDLYVEESGNLQQLANELKRIKNSDVIHLSCHGAESSDHKPSTLVLEDGYGQKEEKNPAELYTALRNHIPRLLMLSACHSADSVTDTLSLSLLQAGMPAVIGMGGAVSDKDATQFTARLYHNLAESASLEHAMGQARFDLLNNEKPASDWHMPRIFLRAEGGGVLSEGNQSRLGQQTAHAEKVFFGAKENPVASQGEFVGRRRQIQHCLSAWRNGHHGVLIKGMGRQGKSSTALRLASRMHQHQLVVIYKHYDANYILKQIKEQANQRSVTEIIEGYDVKDNPQALADCLTELLQSPYKKANQDNKALLLVIDDLEQILKASSDKHQVMVHEQQTLQAVIRSFDQAETDSRLLITSRYEFTLVDQNKDWTTILHTEHMPPISSADSRKQARMRARQDNTKELEWSLEEQCITAAQGNPGLQDWLFGLAFDSPEHCQLVIKQMKAYKESGKAVDDEKLNDWLENLLLTELIAQLNNGQKTLLEALTIFDIPVPESIILKLLDTLSCDEKAWHRLLALSLCDAYSEGSEYSYMVHPLVRPNINKPDPQSTQLLIDDILPNLWQYWKTASRYSQDLQLLRLAVTVKKSDIIAACVENALFYLFQKLDQYDQAQSLASQSLDIIEQQAIKLDSKALHRIAEVLTTTANEIPRARTCYRMALEQAEQESQDEFIICSIRLGYAGLLKNLGEIEEALKQLIIARNGFKKIDATRDYAITIGQIARIRVDKGEVEAALALHEEMLQVFESLGDLRSRAVTLGDIARIRVDKGEVEAALALHEEMLQVFESLGNLRSRAATLGDIARIRVSKGEVELALTLQEERLKIARSLGDMDSIGASQWDLAQIDLQQKDFESATKRLAEAWTIFDKIGRVDFLVAVGNVFGQLLYASEKFDEAQQVFSRTREALVILGREDDIVAIDALIDKCRQ